MWHVIISLAILCSFSFVIVGTLASRLVKDYLSDKGSVSLLINRYILKFNNLLQVANAIALVVLFVLEGDWFVKASYLVDEVEPDTKNFFDFFPVGRVRAGVSLFIPGRQFCLGLESFTTLVRQFIFHNLPRLCRQQAVISSASCSASLSCLLASPRVSLLPLGFL